MDELRRHARYEDFGRIDCTGLCALPGTLNDISLSGLKATFSAPVTGCMEDEYEIALRLSRTSEPPLLLVVAPVWKFERGGMTQMGFSILRSRDSVRLQDYICSLRLDEFWDSDEWLVTEPETATCLFV